MSLATSKLSSTVLSVELTLPYELRFIFSKNIYKMGRMYNDKIDNESTIERYWEISVTAYMYIYMCTCYISPKMNVISLYLLGYSTSRTKCQGKTHSTQNMAHMPSKSGEN